MNKLVKAGLVSLCIASLGVLPVATDFVFQDQVVVSANTATDLGVSLGNSGHSGVVVTVPTTLNQSAVKTEALAAIKKLRAEMWDRNPKYNGRPLRDVASQSGLTTKQAYVDAIKWDTTLEKFAIQRSVEIQYQFTHTRLDGSQEGIENENIAMGPGVTHAIYQQWGYEELDDLEAANGQFNGANGHLHNQLNPEYNSFAVGNVGRYSAQTFSWNQTTNASGTGLSGQHQIAVKMPEAIAKTHNLISNTTPAKPQPDATVVPVTRLYHPQSGNHWFTSDAGVEAYLKERDWKVEGIAFNAPTSGEAVYVLASPSGYFHFTSNVEEIEGLVKIGWRKGDPVFYAAKSGKSVYRVYNPNSGTHHFTSSLEEVAGLVKKGWRNEGHAYYVSN